MTRVGPGLACFLHLAPCIKAMDVTRVGLTLDDNDGEMKIRRIDIKNAEQCADHFSSLEAHIVGRSIRKVRLLDI